MLTILTYVNEFILGYFIFSVFFYTILLLASSVSIINYFNRSEYSKSNTLLTSKILPPVTVIMPAYNEEENIINAVASVLNSTYRNLYIIVVNDASTDNTMKLINEHYQLVEVPVIIEQKIPTSAIKTVYVSHIHPNLMIIDKMKNSGTAGDSFNIGVNACFTPYFVTVDADSVIAPNAISEFVYDVMTQEPAIIVGGGIYIINSCKVKNGLVNESLLPRKIVPALQSVEYMRSSLFGRTGWNFFGGTMCYSGTGTLFDKATVIAAGGFDTNNFSQDAEIVMRLNAYMGKNKYNKRYNVIFNPAAIIWTDVPHNLTQYAKQRDKWRRGLLRGVLRYWYMFFNPLYGIRGLVGFPAFIFFEILAPLIEFTAYCSVGVAYYLNVLSLHQVILFIILAWGFVSYLTIINMCINIITFNQYQRLNDIIRIFVLTVIETFGFRQLGVVVAVYGTFHYVINRLLGKPV